MKVLLILVDGMRPDALAACGSSVPQELRKHSYYSMAARTVYPSVTLPCHMSLFHSVEPARHGILTNTYVPQVRPVDGICEALCKAGKTSAMFYSWEELKDLTSPGTMMRTAFASGHFLGDAAALKIVKDACDCLREDRPDFCFLYLGAVDDKGHDYGWMSREYLDCVKLSLDQAVEAMEAAGDEYITILTADHGGHDRSHGWDIPEDMTIPMFVSHPGFKECEIVSPSILDIAPTVAKILNVPAPREWEGTPLISD